MMSAKRQVNIMIMTKQRQTIYDYFLRHPEKHPTAEEVYEEIRQKEPGIGIATVYRNLKRLVEQGKLRELNLEKQGVRYDLYEQEHYHFICDVCGKVDNFTMPVLDHIDAEVSKLVQGSITSKSLIFHGICQHCTMQKK